jgi:glutamate-1-semialdehyde 2,1-aminomutase
MPACSCFGFGKKAPTVFREWIEIDHEIYNSVAYEMVKRGVIPEPYSREPWFLCASLSYQDIAETTTALEEKIKAVL